MKVVFRLTAVQHVRAEQRMASIAADMASMSAEELEGSYLVGNLMPPIWRHCCSNTDAWLEYDPATRLCAYQGQRGPFRQDGFMSVLRSILGSEEAPEVVSYTTADSRLRWDQTLQDYVLEGLKSGSLQLPDLAAEIAAKGRQGPHYQSWALAAARAVVEKNLYNYTSLALCNPGSPEYRRLAAQGDLALLDHLKVVQEVLKWAE